MCSHPFKPIIFRDTKVLILGTFPSLDSFKYEFYYAHKRNQFWKILEDIFDVKLENEAKKIEFLKKSKIALWDIVKSCQRKNSSDTNLKNIRCNDIPKLLQDYPSIIKIGFTGQKSYKLYQKHFSDLHVETSVLPSPSSAYAKMSIKEKTKIYKGFFFG